MSIDALTAAYERRDLSVTEIVLQAFERIDAIDGKLRMFTYTDRQGALEQARKTDDAYRRGARLGPLAGITFSVKDNIPVAGKPLTFGSGLFQGNIAPQDHVVVARLLRAGAIFIGMTNMPEFAQKPTNENVFYGNGLNPWDYTRTPGGSSGGGAASVATNVVAIGIGTDAGGSVRTPAACCGVLGIKATHGLIPASDLLEGFSSLSQPAPMTRTVADLARTLDVIAGKDESDPWSYAVAPQSLSQNAVARGDLKGLRAAWLPLVGNQRLDTEVRRSCEAILRQLESLGVVIEEHFVDLSASSAIMTPIAGALNRHRFKDLIRDNLDKLDPLFRQRLLSAAQHTAADLQQALVDRTTYFRMVQRWFEKFDVLITPTLSAPPVAADADPAASLLIDGFACGPLRTQWINYCHPFNVSGNPALTVPAGWTASNLPIGIQLVGPWFGEARLLRIAAEIEAFAPWAQKTLPVFT